VFHRRAVAAPGVFPGADLQVATRLVHLDSSTSNVPFPVMEKTISVSLMR
jgi:hypothetical protein